MLPGITPVGVGGAVELSFLGSFWRVVNNDSANFDDFALFLPEGRADTDLFIYVIASDDGLPTTIPGDVTNIYSNTSNTVYTWIGYCVGPSATGIFGFASGTIRGVSAAAVLHFRGQDLASPFDVTRTVANGTTGVPNPPSITPVTDGCIAIAVGVLDDDEVESDVTAPSGYTLVGARDSIFAGVTLMIAIKQLGAAGAENPAAFGVGAGDDAWTAVTMAVRPG